MNTTSRASRKCYAVARQRIVYHDHNNNRSRCFSSILNNSQFLPSIKQDGEEQNYKHCRANYQIAVQPTIYNNNNDIIRRQYHITSHNERSGVAVVMGLGALAATAKAGQYAVEGYKEWQSAREAEEKELEEFRKANPDAFKEEETINKSQDSSKSSSSSSSSEQSTKSKEDDGKRENIFSKFFDMSVGSKFYEGGFEDKMTRKEAALILGVRESSAAKRIKEAHRKLLILNHPDTGGSTFIAGKINEAKELLLKGKK